MKFLTLETTCDETAAAVVTEQLEVLGSVVASQDDLHERFGGVVPEIASRAHVERILPVIDEALRRAGVRLADLDAVAVANTPGLAGSLLVGLVAAKTICVALGIPLIAVNHLQAHIYACRLASREEVFPCVGLIISGGHTCLYRCQTPLDFELLGATVDDAAGEAFDKVANMLGLAYPGGPSIQQLQRPEDRGPLRDRWPRPAGFPPAPNPGPASGRPGCQLSGGRGGCAGRQGAIGPGEDGPLYSVCGRRRGGQPSPARALGAGGRTTGFSAVCGSFATLHGQRDNGSDRRGALPCRAVRGIGS